MDSIWRFLGRLSLLLALFPPATAAEVDTAHQPTQVRAVLFYSPACPQCGELFEFYLPLLFERYGTRLQVAGIDVSKSPGQAVYRAATPALGLPVEWGNTPTVAVQDQAMVGLDAIAAGLGDHFEALAAIPGNAAWPMIPGLPVLLEPGMRDIEYRLVAAQAARPIVAPEASAAPTSAMGDRIANGLAILVLIGMLAALVHSLLRLRQAPSSPSDATPAIVVALTIGLGISGYLAYTSLVDVAPVCGPLGGCDRVQQSEYAKLFGIPMGVLGLMGYGTILFTWLLARRLSPKGGGWRWLPLAIGLFGVLFSLRLTYLEPFVIGHTCLWCLGSAITITSVLWLLAGETRLKNSAFQQTPLP